MGTAWIIVAAALAGALVATALWQWRTIRLLRRHQQRMAELLHTIEEQPALMKMAQTPADDEARQLIRHRYDMISELLAAVVSDDHERCNAVLDGLEELVADPAVFTRQLRLIYSRLQPIMMSRLLECGLSEREVDICCLYALGLNGKTIQQYTHNGRHFQHVGQIRKKLGLSEHDKNIDGYIRDLLK
ncbi:MAG: hypothetical protein J6W01_02570 [Bacteroidales bacterium]|nr:hypothetical protein [Bacteroidales bacterium]